MSKTKPKPKKDELYKHSARKVLLKKSYRKQSHWGFLYWVVFCCSIAFWGILFGSRFTTFDNDSKLAEKLIQQSQKFVMDHTAVLGLTDSTEGVASGGSDLSETIAQELDAVDNLTLDQVEAVVDQLEEERKDKLRKSLGLDLPKETDNPNFPVTFEAPTESGVEIQVDGAGFAPAISPYSLLMLSVGEHVLNFRYIDKDEVTQNLEESIVIIPRPPIWAEDQKTLFTIEDQVVMRGTALPNSRVVLLVNSTLVSIVADADGNGLWSAAIEQELESGEHMAVAFVRKSGYASNFSEPLSFTIGQNSPEAFQGIVENKKDSTTTELLFGLVPYTENNYYIVMAGTGIILIILLIIFSKIIKSTLYSRHEKDTWITKSKDSTPEDKENVLTLREKFQQAGIGVGNVRINKLAKVKDKDKVQDQGQEKNEDDIKSPTKEDKKGSAEATEEVQNEKPEKNEAQTPDEPEAVEVLDKQLPEKGNLSKETSGSKVKAESELGKIYSKDEFLKTFGSSEPTAHYETNKLRISLTSNKGK